MRGFKIAHGDFVSNGSGRFETVSGMEKVRRDIYKLLVTDTEFPSNITNYSRYNPFYGIALNNKNLFSNLSKSDAIELINSMLRTALTNYVNIQKSQTNIPTEELIDYFDFITTFDTQNPRLARSKIQVKLITGSSIEDLGTFIQEVQ